jgi:putative DNA primase/helicase
MTEQIDKVKDQVRGLVEAARPLEPTILETQSESTQSDQKSHTSTDKRPSIYAGAADLGEILDQTWDALTAHNVPPRLLRFGTAMVVVGESDGEVGIRRLSADSLREELARACCWYGIKRNGNDQVRHDAYPPLAVARTLLIGDLSRLPNLSRIAHAPFMTPSGEIVHRQGYDRETQTWCAPGLELPPIPERPSEVEIVEAREMFTRDLLGDFPFSDRADKANMVALYLLPIARELIEGPTPLHLIEKPSPGSGASLLLETLGILVSGTPPASLTEASHEEEWRKRITSTLLRAPEIIIIDNLRRRLDSAALSSALTSRNWQDRILGSSENVSLPIRCVWAATGNNPAVSGEISRRSIPIRINPNVEHPWDRTGFRHPKLSEWTLENRGRLLQAAMILLRAWDVADRPKGDATLGSYEQWSAVMGGILKVAGIEGFLDNRARFHDRADRESSAWSAFVAAWRARFGESHVGTKDLWQLLAQVDPPCDLGNGGDRSQHIRFGDSLAQAVDRRFTVDGQSVKIESAGLKQSAKQYRLVLGDR